MEIIHLCDQSKDNYENDENTRKERILMKFSGGYLRKFVQLVAI